VDVVALLSQGRTAAAQCGLFTHKSVPVIFEPPCISLIHKFQKQRTEQILSQKDNKYPSRILSVKFSFYLAIEALMPVYCFHIT